jgi:hypothetical protein
MIITDKFVYIHMPKTGGTFVTSVLEQIYCRPKEEAKHPPAWARLPGKYPPKRYRRLGGPEMKHAGARKIPPQFRHLPVVGCIRNPYDRYVSEYHFHWWKEHPEHYPSIAALPGYPDVSFDAFVRALNEQSVLGFQGLHLDPTVGRDTYLILAYYSRDPHAFLKSVEGRPLTTEMVREALVTSRLLNTERLNEELDDFLGSVGIPAEEREFIRATPKIRPPGGDREDQHRWEQYYSPELREFVRDRERILFELFPAFDV